MVPKIDFNYDKIDNRIKLFVNKTKIYEYTEANTVLYPFDVGNSDSDKDIEVVIELQNDKKPDKEYEVYAYYFNDDEYESVFKDLSSEKMKILKNDNGYIKGEVNVKDKNYLLLSTEYTDEWEIKVDGKKVKYDEVFNTFVGLKLEKGKHTIEMKFHPRGFKTGIALSIVSLVLAIIYLRNETKNNG